jgi:hypothetical protein
MQMHRLTGSLLVPILVALAGCGGGDREHDYSGSIVHSIRTNGARRILWATNGLAGFGKAAINRASCVQTADTQSYACIVDYTYHNSEGTYRYEIHVSATCRSGGQCRWRVDGPGTLVGAEPD